MSQVLRDVGGLLFFNFHDEVSRRSFLTLRYQIVGIIPILGCTSVWERLLYLLKTSTSTLLPRMSKEHLRSTLKTLFAPELTAVISFFFLRRHDFLVPCCIYVLLHDCFFLCHLKAALFHQCFFFISDVLSTYSFEAQCFDIIPHGGWKSLQDTEPRLKLVCFGKRCQRLC